METSSVSKTVEVLPAMLACCHTLVSDIRLGWSPEFVMFLLGSKHTQCCAARDGTNASVTVAQRWWDGQCL